MTDILIQLQNAAWRDIEFPVTEREYGFQQAQARHKFLFVNNELIESLGRDNPTYRYTIPFREDIQSNIWQNLFTQVYPDFLAACQDNSRGVLTDPLHGPKPAKCVSLREIVNVNRRDGIDVEAEFIFAPQETDFSTNLGSFISTLRGAREYALRFDAEVAKQFDTDALGRSIAQVEPPEPTVNPLDAITGIGDQLNVAGNQVTAALADTAFRAEKAGAAIDRLKNPSLEPQRQQARRLQEAVLALEDKTDPTGTRPLRKVVNTTDRGIAAVAALVGLSVAELLKLNPALRKSPLVKANTEIRVFASTLAK